MGKLANYKALFFDFDDTIINFKAAEKIALPQVFEEYGFTLTEQVNETYQRINRGLWDSLEQGSITRAYLLKSRFEKTFECYGKQVDGKQMDERFRSLLAHTIVLMDGVEQLFETLHKKYDLYIVTNGVTSTQYERLKASKLERYFKKVFVSEETGYQKPQVEFFDYVFANIDENNRKDCLIIGDSYSADMIGGRNAGMDTCWYNPNQIKIEKIYEPTMTITHFNELLTCLGE